MKKVQNKIEQKEIARLTQLFQRKEFKNLEIETKKLIKEYDNNIILLNFCAISLIGQKKNEEAIKIFKKLINLDPKNVDAHYNLANALVEIKNYEEAIINFKKAINLNSKYLPAYINLGNLFKEIKMLDDSVKIYMEGLNINSNEPLLHYNLGNAFSEKGEFQKAINSYNNAIKLNPNNPEAYSNLGTVYKNLGKLKDSFDAFSKAISINPKNFIAFSGLGLTLKKLKKFPEAIQAFKEGIKINPNFVPLLNNMGNIMKDIGKIEEAKLNYLEAIKINPKNSSTFSNYLFSLNFLNKLNPKEYLDEASKYKDSIKLINKNLLIPYKYEKKIKKIKIGFISADFKNHPVGFFLLDTIKNLKNMDLELIAYSNSFEKDNLTDEIKPYFSKWKLIRDKNDLDVTNLIRNDGIHILFDLSGHSADNRLPIFIQRSAPIQVTGFGYLASTGIKEFDYIFGDPHATPLEDQYKFSEKIFQLDKIWCCMSKSNLFPKFVPNKNKHITFGCFNNVSKINDNVLNCYSKILEKVPNSKLLLKYDKYDSKFIQQYFYEKFKSHNIDNNRIIFEGFSKRLEFIEKYNDIDIALDTFPYNGGTTNFEAAFMGVPILTMKNEYLMFRCGESINKNLKMNDWIAENNEDFITKAINFSKNKDYLKNLKIKLKKDSVNSPLFDSLNFASNLRNAFWKMWEVFLKKDNNKN